MFVGTSALALGLSFGLLFVSLFSKSDQSSFKALSDDNKQFVRQFPSFVIFLGRAVTVLYLLAAAGGKQETLIHAYGSCKLMDSLDLPKAAHI